jgi:hypothetical protein
MACSTGCRTQDCASWGECVRKKSLQIGDVTAHKFNQAQHQTIKDYVNAREAGLQPEGVTRSAVDNAWKATDAAGTPFRADQ